MHAALAAMQSVADQAGIKLPLRADQ